MRLLLIISVCTVCQLVQAQTYYVDPAKGNDASPGTIDQPLATLEKAVNVANSYVGKDAITIRIAPGLYIINNSLRIRRAAEQTKTSYTLEAIVMPDDNSWAPAKMPVILCTADSNRVGRLPHASAAIQVECSRVSFRGLKFTGNPNPVSQYYYVIERKDSSLNGLEVSQCYFVGDKNTAPIQGGLFTQGAGIHVDHCVFYSVKNAVMTFTGICRPVDWPGKNRNAERFPLPAGAKRPEPGLIAALTCMFPLTANNGNRLTRGNFAYIKKKCFGKR